MKKQLHCEAECFRPWYCGGGYHADEGNQLQYTVVWRCLAPSFLLIRVSFSVFQKDYHPDRAPSPCKHFTHPGRSYTSCRCWGVEGKTGVWSLVLTAPSPENWVCGDAPLLWHIEHYLNNSWVNIMLLSKINIAWLTLIEKLQELKLCTAFSALRPEDRHTLTLYYTIHALIIRTIFHKRLTLTCLVNVL